MDASNRIPARLPIPGNAEFFFTIVSFVVIAIVAGVSSRVGWADWIEVVRWLGAAYLISRGIAKASRAHEQ
jgi:threonine/homoserine/homoserine lactone efflux protein